MGIFRKMISIFHDDWCRKCQYQMDETWRQLYMLPMRVGHYIEHNDANYYINNLYKVNCKADIPIGTYACGIIKYRCSRCGSELVKLSIFLPVRDQEKYEDTVYFNNGELDNFLRK
ncbi:MAG: hypothetical protein HFJ45_03780 [Clostridia bacterium]|nr:hypothetical protein [Clostridia bacterium]